MRENRAGFVVKLLIHKFGNNRASKFLELLDSVKQHDKVIAESLDNNLDNLLLLSKDQFEELSEFIKDLSKTSKFAAVFFIEKIPVLNFYGIYTEFKEVVSLIKDYNARNIAYLIGSSSLNHDDIDRTLSKVELSYYKELLKQVRSEHQKLQALSASILINAHPISQAIKKESLKEYIVLCESVYQKFGYDLAELFVKNTPKITQALNQKKILPTLERLFDKGSGYLEFFLYFPDKIAPNMKPKSEGEIDKKEVIKIMSKDPIDVVNRFPDLVNNKYFLAILVFWESFSEAQKKNMISQLSTDNYLNYLLKNKAVSSELKQILKSTSNKWFEPWGYPHNQIDEKFIYLQIKKTVFSGKNYSLNQNLIQEKLAEIRSQKHSIDKMLAFLKDICTNKDTLRRLDLLEDISMRNSKSSLISYLSEEDLYLSTWDRDPWVDYSRSDELFACTNLGDYASYNSPAFLADLNINNIDVWSNNDRVGRIYLYLVEDEESRLILLVDRVNGSDRIVRHKKRLDFILSAIEEYARHIGIDKVIINSEISFNNTPKQFVDYVKSKLTGEKFFYIKRFIPGGAVQKTLPNSKNSFLEAINYKDGGIMKGYQISV